MEARYQTPLLDCVRRGEVAPDIRMLAARGVLAPRALEQLALLTWLAHDVEPQIRSAAEDTLARIPRAVLVRFLARTDVPDDVRAFFGQRDIVAEGLPIEAAEESLCATDDQANDLDPADLTESHPASQDAAVPMAAGDEAIRESTVQRLSKMSITQKVKAAMRGNRDVRAILIRDPNKLVSIAVLASPRLTEQEVENYAKMASVPEDVLRVIGTTRAWVKNYGIFKALTFNPKTPIAISMGMVNRLNERDVKSLSSDRNIAEPVKLLARKIVAAGQTRKH
jgi:hypothetical protein